MANAIDANNRWRWWYEAIADWMLAHPEGKLGDCAKHLSKSPAYISTIINSDMYKEYFAKRRTEWRESHDFNIISKTTKIAELGLDLILENFEKKRDTVPLGVLKDVTDSALSRLGYGAPAVGAPVAQTTTVNVVQVSAQDLAEARALVRNQETKLLGTPSSAARLLSQAPVGQHDDEVSVNASAS